MKHAEKSQIYRLFKKIISVDWELFILDIFPVASFIFLILATIAVIGLLIVIYRLI